MNLAQNLDFGGGGRSLSDFTAGWSIGISIQESLSTLAESVTRSSSLMQGITESVVQVQRESQSMVQSFRDLSAPPSLLSAARDAASAFRSVTVMPSMKFQLPAPPRLSLGDTLAPLKQFTELHRSFSTAITSPFLSEGLQTGTHWTRVLSQDPERAQALALLAADPAMKAAWEGEISDALALMPESNSLEADDRDRIRERVWTRVRHAARQYLAARRVTNAQVPPGPRIIRLFLMPDWIKQELQRAVPEIEARRLTGLVSRASRKLELWRPGDSWNADAIQEACLSLLMADKDLLEVGDQLIWRANDRQKNRHKRAQALSFQPLDGTESLIQDSRASYSPDLLGSRPVKTLGEAEEAIEILSSHGVDLADIFEVLGGPKHLIRLVKNSPHLEAKIRMISSAGLAPGSIGKTLSIRYQKIKRIVGDPDSR